MNIHLTERAYAAFANREGAASEGRGTIEAKLQACADDGGLACVQWHGKPALYALDAYWRYEAQDGAVALTECVGVFHVVSVARWERPERRPERSIR